MKMAYFTALSARRLRDETGRKGDGHPGWQGARGKRGRWCFRGKTHGGVGNRSGGGVGCTAGKVGVAEAAERGRAAAIPPARDPDSDRRA